MAVSDYITLPSARAYAGIDDSLDDDTLQPTITAISRKVDAHCKRHFYTVTEARYFPASDYCLAYVDDISTTSGLTVKTDDNDDGTYETTWTITTDFELGPRNRTVGGVINFPYTRIVAVGGKSFPRAVRRQGPVEVTATFGWSSVPDEVEHATAVLVKWLWKITKEAPLGVAGFSEFGTSMRVRDNPAAAMLLKPFVRDPVLVG